MAAITFPPFFKDRESGDSRVGLVEMIHGLGFGV